MSKQSQQKPLSWSTEQPKDNKTKVKLGEKNRMHDAKTAIGSDFDKETAKKMALSYIAQLNMANCMLQ